jgi:hypothetical protein
VLNTLKTDKTLNSNFDQFLLHYKPTSGNTKEEWNNCGIKEFFGTVKISESAQNLITTIADEIN